MSKQVVFYQDAEGSKAFVEFITRNCGIILTEQGEIVSVDEVQQIAAETSGDFCCRFGNTQCRIPC